MACSDRERLKSGEVQDRREVIQDWENIFGSRRHCRTRVSWDMKTLLGSLISQIQIMRDGVGVLNGMKLLKASYRP